MKPTHLHRAAVATAVLPIGTAITASATTAQPVTTVIKPAGMVPPPGYVL